MAWTHLEGLVLKKLLPKERDREGLDLDVLGVLALRREERGRGAHTAGLSKGPERGARRAWCQKGVLVDRGAAQTGQPGRGSQGGGSSQDSA